MNKKDEKLNKLLFCTYLYNSTKVMRTRHICNYFWNFFFKFFYLENTKQLRTFAIVIY